MKLLSHCIAFLKEMRKTGLALLIGKAAAESVSWMTLFRTSHFSWNWKGKKKTNKKITWQTLSRVTDVLYECLGFSFIMEIFWLFAWLSYKYVPQKITWTGIGYCILYLCLLKCKLGRSCKCICSTFFKVCWFFQNVLTSMLLIIRQLSLYVSGCFICQVTISFQKSS